MDGHPEYQSNYQGYDDKLFIPGPKQRDYYFIGVTLLFRLSHQRGSFSKSLFGILSASTPEKAGGTGLVPSSQNRARVVINCPQKGDAAGKYILTVYLEEPLNS
ncbi:hypothetical protein Leryth_004618 [Lithospermum erythrorhizon]|nr:hypothetical protein Leryth_004618 [Lithospermum erythrorhizon]